MNILLVDPHPDTRRALAALLVRCGHEVSTCPDVLSAVPHVMETAADLVIVAVDFGLGTDLARIVRQSRPKLKFMLVTVGDDIAGPAKQAGCPCFVKLSLTTPGTMAAAIAEATK